MSRNNGNTSTKLQPTCEDRIAEHLESRLETFTALTKAMQVDTDDDLAAITDDELSEITGYGNTPRNELDPNTVREQACDRQNELPLSVELLHVVKILLSTGGPEDYFEVWADDDGEITRIDYAFKDWFDGARRTLSGPEFDTAAEFLGSYTEIFAQMGWKVGTR